MKEGLYKNAAVVRPNTKVKSGPGDLPRQTLFVALKRKRRSCCKWENNRE